jgi:hypothetical protein
MVGALLFVLFAAVLIGVATAAVSSDQRRRGRAAELAGALDLQLARADTSHLISMSGTIDGFSVRIDAHPSRAALLTATVTGDAIPRDLNVQRRLFGTIEAHATGDAAFDREFLIDGHATRVSSLLTSNVRAALLELPPSASVGIDYGKLTAIFSLARDATEANN